MDIFGKTVCAGRPMSNGVKSLLLKALKQHSLNNYNSDELKFMHLVLCKMYNYTLNILLFKEALSNTGCRDDDVLNRKVPIEIWKILYDGCQEMGVTEEMLQVEKIRADLWLHFNSHPELLHGLTMYVTNKIGLNHQVDICENNITDGNYLYNLGAVLPSRLLMSIAYCILFWGKQECEPWIRLFLNKVFILYLIVSGYIIPKKSLLMACGNVGYLGPIEVIWEDIACVQGIPVLHEHINRPDSKTLEYLFIFNNNFSI
nr:homolog of EHV2 ORF18 protein UL79 [Macronycteris gammaherpesvirus 1]BEG23088.1 homolog of EHV2 ORF18 protein UL79 [Macronycteris gammaherpesvirus 1]